MNDLFLLTICSPVFVFSYSSFLFCSHVVWLQAKSARESVTRVLKTCHTGSRLSDDKIYVQILDALFQVFSDGITNPRLSLPLMNTYAFLVTSGYLDDDDESDAAHVKSVLKMIWNLIRRSADPVKKITAASLICSSLRFKCKKRRTGWKKAWKWKCIREEFRARMRYD